MTREERDAEIKRLQAKRDHCDEMVGLCFQMAAAVFAVGIFFVALLSFLGL